MRVPYNACGSGSAVWLIQLQLKGRGAPINLPAGCLYNPLHPLFLVFLTATKPGSEAVSEDGFSDVPVESGKARGWGTSVFESQEGAAIGLS